MKILHDSRQILFREPFGSVNCCDEVHLRVETDPDFGGTLEIRLWIEDQEEVYRMKKVSDELHEFCAVMPEKPGHVWYYFIVHQDGEHYYLGNSEHNLGGEGVLYRTQPPSFQITVTESFSVPSWFQNQIMYQIFPDSFCNGNPDGRINSPKKGSFLYAHWDNPPSYHKDSKGNILEWGFFGGNLQGIILKLDYVKSLGVGALYLNPIFEAASPHRYDTGDYLKIDGVLGILEDFDQLIAEARKRDIGIILDGVFSHTGANSRYFNKKGTYDSIGAYNSPESPYYPWYTFKEYPDDYDCWWGVDDLPNVKELNPSYRQFIYEGEDSVIRYWIRRGVMGFRLDVADELPEDFIRGLRKTMQEENPEAVLIGEVWEDASNKVTYGELRNYFEGDLLHSVMNYPFYQAMLDFALQKISAKEIQDIILSLYENYPKEAILSAMNLIGSHDRARIRTLLKEGSQSNGSDASASDQGLDRLFLITGMQMCLPGNPSIYYGDEAGLEGSTDPYNRGTYPWGHEDQQILSWYQKLIHMRSQELFPLLSELPQVKSITEHLLLIRYSSLEKEIWILVNNHPSQGEHFQVEARLEEEGPILEFPRETIARELLYDLPLEKGSNGEIKVFVPPQKTIVICVTLSQ